MWIKYFEEKNDINIPVQTNIFLGKDEQGIFSNKMTISICIKLCIVVVKAKI